jgi:hypothetical protein
MFWTSKKKTNNQGGWGKETSRQNSSEHATDKTLIPQLSKLLSDKTHDITEILLKVELNTIK